MGELYVKFKGRSWVKSAHVGDFKEYIKNCHLEKINCSYLIVEKDEKWKHKFMEEENRKKKV